MKKTIFSAVLVTFLVSLPCLAADLPKATQALLSKAHLDGSVLTGLDAELTVPKDWLNGVKGEPPVKILGSWDPRQFTELSGPFHERYPAIKIDYSRATTNDRSIKTLIAYKDGRYIADIIASASNTWIDFRDAGGLVDLRVLPNFQNLPPENRNADGYWIGHNVSYRCISYNVNRVQKDQLPKTWDDLIANPYWRNGMIAIPDEPSIWLSMLWDAKGESWTTDFIRKLFAVVKPQLRKEGINAGIGLTAVGETPAFIGASQHRVKQYADKGAPVSWHCPEPVPVGISQLMMLKGSPAPNGAKVFLNWLLSREGQLAQYATDGSAPAHKDMEKDPHFQPYPEQIIGKTLAVRDEDKIQTDFPKLMAVYQPLWQSAGGPTSQAKDGD
jgi:iron(III) transport system substrate-binding protein